MLALRGLIRRQFLWSRIADAVACILPAIAGMARTGLILRHAVENVELPMWRITPVEAKESGGADDDFAVHDMDRHFLAALISELTWPYSHGRWRCAAVEHCGR